MTPKECRTLAHELFRGSLKTGRELIERMDPLFAERQMRLFGILKPEGGEITTRPNHPAVESMLIKGGTFSRVCEKKAAERLRS